jgi:hypothetical protein
MNERDLIQRANGPERGCPTRSSPDCRMSARNLTGFWFAECAAAETAAPKARNLKTKLMIDFIFIAVIALFFVAGGLYARWCEKL